MNEAGIPELGETILAPLLDTAAEFVRGSETEDLPSSLRPLLGFDRRGLVRGVARHQLLHALESEDDFRKKVVEAFLERREVNAVLASWTVSNATEHVQETSERGDLPLLASALFAARPSGWMFGLGAVLAVFQADRHGREEHADVVAYEQQVALAEEARRRAEAAYKDVEARVAGFEHDLKEERRERRNRANDAQRVIDLAQRKVADAEQVREQVQAELQAEHERLERERQRGRELHNDLSNIQKELRLAQAEIERGGLGLRQSDLEALENAADLSRRLSTGLNSVTDRARRSVAEPLSQKAHTGQHRVKLNVPPGLASDDPQAVHEMLCEKGMALIVDGYNVSMQGWGDATIADQRDRLITALGALQTRTHCDVTVVFDGADVDGARPMHRPGVHVIFSQPGEEADVVIVREVATQPVHIPILVVSSDAWVRDHSEKEGARVVPARSLLGALKA